MKKISKCLVSVFLSAFLLLSWNLTVFAQDIDIKLRPYQQIIDKLNEEYGTDMFISTENAQKVYNKISSKSLCDFEADLRSDLLEFYGGNCTDVNASTNELPINGIKSELSPTPRFEIKRMIAEWGYGSARAPANYYGKLYVDIGVESMEFTTIYEWGYYEYNNIFFVPSKCVKTSSTGQAVSVKYTGTYCNIDYISLTGINYVYATFYSNGDAAKVVA